MKKKLHLHTSTHVIVCQMSKYVLFSSCCDDIFVFLQNGGKNISMKQKLYHFREKCFEVAGFFTDFVPFCHELKLKKHVGKQCMYVHF